MIQNLDKFSTHMIQFTYKAKCYSLLELKLHNTHILCTYVQQTDTQELSVSITSKFMHYYFYSLFSCQPLCMHACVHEMLLVSKQNTLVQVKDEKDKGKQRIEGKIYLITTCKMILFHFKSQWLERMSVLASISTYVVTFAA